MQKTHFRYTGNARHDACMSALQLVQSMQQPHADAMQMPAYILAREYVERLARGSEGNPLGRERRRDPGATRARHEIRSPTDDGEREAVGERFPEHHQVRGRPHTVALDRAADRQPKRRLDLIEYDHCAVSRRLDPHTL